MGKRKRQKVVESSDSESQDEEVAVETLQQVNGNNESNSEDGEVPATAASEQLLRQRVDLQRYQTRVFDVSGDEWEPDSDALHMPAQGILIGAANDEEFPFHHCYPYPLKKNHVRRLFAHGIVIKNSLFSRLEDQQIIENWRSFAEHNNIMFENAPLYCGWVYFFTFFLLNILNSYILGQAYGYSTPRINEKVSS